LFQVAQETVSEQIDAFAIGLEISLNVLQLMGEKFSAQKG